MSDAAPRRAVALRTILVAAVALTAATLTCAAAQAPSPSSASPSLFTAAQSARGAEVYAGRCALCHGPALTGGGGAPALKGPDFLFGWSSKSTGDLVEFVSTKMPPGQPHTLADAQYADAVAYILSVNGFRPGAEELSRQSPRPIGEP